MSSIQFINSRSFAREMDDADELYKYRSQFHHPKLNGKTATYFCGNSLGLQPKAAKSYLIQELDDWALHGVEGHFKAVRPWFGYHHNFTKSVAKLVGAKDKEVVVMNTLTVNLQLLMLTFYKPTEKRYKIIMEAGAFPSDMYAVETLVISHGLKPKDVIIEIAPRKGKHTVDEADILEAIKKNKSSLAMVMIGGVNYYTGQVFDMASITEAAQKAGAKVGFDLAHAVGNIPLQLNKWGVDFACWCTYKYLNSGPGGVGGVYINEKHATNTDLARLSGWWGHNEKTRFKMEKGYDPMPNAQSWQMSNAPIMNMAAHRASLDIFDEVGIKALRAKSEQLTGFLRYLLEHLTHLDFTTITPIVTKQSGCQLSLLFAKNGKQVFDFLTKNNIIADWREPNVIRVAPVPLYNSFEDVYDLYDSLKQFKAN
jgi:kynureninase